MIGLSSPCAHIHPCRDRPNNGHPIPLPCAALLTASSKSYTKSLSCNGPSASIFNCPNIGSVDIEPAGNFSIRHPHRIQATNFVDDGNGQFCVDIFLPNAGTPARSHLRHIIQMRAKMKVARVYAIWRIAGMENKKIGRNRPHNKLVCHAMRGCYAPVSPAHAESPISTRQS